jgi:outer membrane protein TolC
VQAELARLEGERRTWAAQLNALLNRPVAARLAPPAALRPLPSPEALALEALIERARQASPQLAVDAARITADRRAAELVRRNWYPDVTLGLSVFDRDEGNDRDFGGYEANGGLRRALAVGPAPGS